MVTDEFGLLTRVKVGLILKPAVSLFAIFCVLSIYYAIAPGRAMGQVLTFGTGAALFYSLYELYELYKWFNFTVKLNDQAIIISDETIPWDHVLSAKAKDAIQFDTFIELETHAGKVYKIPGAIQETDYILAKVRKHVHNTITLE